MASFDLCIWIKRINYFIKSSASAAIILIGRSLGCSKSLTETVNDYQNGINESTLKWTSDQLHNKTITY